MTKRRLGPAVLAATLSFLYAAPAWAADLPDLPVNVPVALPDPAVAQTNAVPQPVSQAADAAVPPTPQEPVQTVVGRAGAMPQQADTAVRSVVQPARPVSDPSTPAAALTRSEPPSRRPAPKHASRQSPTGLPAVDRAHHDQRAGRTASPSRLASASAAVSHSPEAAAAADLGASRGRPADSPNFPLPAPFGAAASGAGSSGGLVTVFALLLAALAVAAPEVGARLLPGTSPLRRLRIVSLLERPG